jgi:hypothetical protein
MVGSLALSQVGRLEVMPGRGGWYRAEEKSRGGGGGGKRGGGNS